MLTFFRCLRSCVGVAPVGASPLLLLRFVYRDASVDSPPHSPTVSSTLNENRLPVRTLVLDELPPRQLDLFFQYIDFVTHGFKMFPPEQCQRILAELVRKAFRGCISDSEDSGNKEHHAVRPLLDVVLLQNTGPFCGWFHHGYEETLLPEICRDYLPDTFLQSSSGMWLQQRATLKLVKSEVYHAHFGASLVKPFHAICLATLRELNSFYLCGLQMMRTRSDYSEAERSQLILAVVEGKRIRNISHAAYSQLGHVPSGAVALMRYVLASGDVGLNREDGLLEGDIPLCLRGMWSELDKLLGVAKDVSANDIKWGLEETLPTGCALLNHTLLFLFGDISHADRSEVLTLLITELKKMHNIIVKEGTAFLEHFEWDTTETLVGTRGEIGLYDNAFLDEVLHETNSTLYPLNSHQPQWAEDSKNLPPNPNTYGELSGTLVGMGLNSNGYLSKMLAACDMLSSASNLLGTESETAPPSLEEVDSLQFTLHNMRHSLRVVIGRRYMLAPHPTNWSELDRQRAIPFLEALSVSLCIRKRFVVLVVGPQGKIKEHEQRRPAIVCNNSFLTLSVLFPSLTPSILYAEELPNDPPLQASAPSWIYFPCSQQRFNHSQDSYLRVTSEHVKKIKQLATKNAYECVALGLICTENSAVEEVFPVEEWFHRVFPLVLRS